MRTMTFVTIVFAVCSLNAAGANQRYAIPTKDQVPVYQNETRKVFEQALFFIGRDDRCVVKTLEKAMVRIGVSGKTGWVETSEVRLVSESSTFSYENAEILEYLDNPSPINVIDGNQPFDHKLSLDRSFADELRQNVDRETVARQAGE
jgi:hypothetical protein